MPDAPPRAPGELAEIERRAFAESMRAWGENDPNPEWFAGDCLSIVLMDCGRAGAMIDTLLDEIAALRASGDGGEAMREAAAALCDGEARDQHHLAVAHLGSDDSASDTAYGAEEAAKSLAEQIRALPLSSPTKIEGADDNG